MGACVTNKKMYLTPEIAEDALIELRTKFDYAPGTGPITIYKCEDCGYYHLTSKGTMNEKLARYLSEGKIQLQKEADHWLGKMKNR